MHTQVDPAGKAKLARPADYRMGKLIGDPNYAETPSSIASFCVSPPAANRMPHPLPQHLV
jgi:hypothetical protein